MIELDNGDTILKVQGSALVPTYSFGNAGIDDFSFVSYFAIGPDGTLYADNLNGAFDPYQQIVRVADGQATSLWRGAASR